MINFSVVRNHLVHFSVQVTTWWWFKYSRGFIGIEGIHIRFTEIVALVGSIQLIHLLFRQQLNSLSILLSCPPFRLSSDGVSSLWIIYYRHCHQLFLHWRLKLLFQVKLRQFSSFQPSHQLLHNPINIANFSIGGILKPKIQTETLQNYQEVEFLKQKYRQRYFKILKWWDL